MGYKILASICGLLLVLQWLISPTFISNEMTVLQLNGNAADYVMGSKIEKVIDNVSILVGLLGLFSIYKINSKKGNKDET
jgi:hypothetical protein